MAAEEVGELTVDYSEDGRTVDVSYSMTEPVSEINIFVGDEQLPRRGWPNKCKLSRKEK